MRLLQTSLRYLQITIQGHMLLFTLLKLTTFNWTVNEIHSFNRYVKTCQQNRVYTRYHNDYKDSKECSQKNENSQMAAPSGTDYISGALCYLLSVQLAPCQHNHVRGCPKDICIDLQCRGFLLIDFYKNLPFFLTSVLVPTSNSTRRYISRFIRKSSELIQLCPVRQ